MGLGRALHLTPKVDPHFPGRAWGGTNSQECPTEPWTKKKNEFTGLIPVQGGHDAVHRLGGRISFGAPRQGFQELPPRACQAVARLFTGTPLLMLRFLCSHCQAVADIIRTTLGPRSMLKMLLDAAGGECHVAAQEWQQQQQRECARHPQ